MFCACGMSTERLPAAERAKSEPVLFEFALYFSPKPSANPEAELERLLTDRSRRMHLAGAVAAAEAIVTVGSKWSPLADYAPPSAESLRYMGVGVPAAAAADLAKADRVFILGFSTPAYGVLVANRSACALMADLATATGGMIWDEETRQLYSVERWRKDRVESWQGSLPDMTSHVTMHAYANPELVRIITLGMRKFGLPDLVVAEIPSRQTRPVGNLINAVMQRLVEGQQVADNTLRLALSEIRHEAGRTRALTNPGKDAKGIVQVSVQVAPAEKGDPSNTLWRLDFPESKLGSVTERALWGANELFGSTDQIIGARSEDAEMAAARIRARAAFFAQEARFRAGLQSMEHLLVKGPFRQDDETEFMWVEIVKWGPKEVEGLLTSDPRYVKRLHPGSRVTVRLDDIFDYILYKPDGTQEGNESGKVLERLQKSR